MSFMFSKTFQADTYVPVLCKFRDLAADTSIVETVSRLDLFFLFREKRGY